MATKTGEQPAIEVHPNELDGWDVVHSGTSDAISNHPDKESALDAARRIAEHEGGELDVRVREDVVDEISDAGRGTTLYFVIVLGLLAVVVLILIVVSVIGGVTEFGANDANLGE
jgi:Uncharacterized protein conserved in bacteria (DUF2188)